jgi:hypothetical protein
MAETTGLVQRISVGSAFTCVWVGPTPTNTELLLVMDDGTAAGAATAGNLTQALVTASTNYRPVSAIHGDNNARVTAVRVDPV